MNEEQNYKKTSHLERFAPRNPDGSEPEVWNRPLTCYRCCHTYTLKTAIWVKVDSSKKRQPACPAPNCGCKCLAHNPRF